MDSLWSWPFATPFTLTEFLGGVLLFVGTAFVLIAAIGLVRMPDLYLRMSVTTKAATLGVMLTLIATALTLGDLGVTSRAAGASIFLLLTAPVAAHMVGRAAYRAGVPLWEGTAVDELRTWAHGSDGHMSAAAEEGEDTTTLPLEPGVASQ